MAVSENTDELMSAGTLSERIHAMLPDAVCNLSDNEDGRVCGTVQLNDRVVYLDTASCTPGWFTYRRCDAMNGWIGTGNRSHIGSDKNAAADVVNLLARGKSVWRDECSYGTGVDY